MARPRNSSKAQATKSTSTGKFLSSLRRHFTLKSISKFIFDPSASWLAMLLLFIAEIAVNAYVIARIPYTEIDWKAYMQEVEGVVNGTFDYDHLKGDTGPLVYPAGFVYVYLILYYVTNFGKNIVLAQYIFSALYLITLILVFRIYHRAQKIPPYALVFMCCTSYRVHSIFVLRLFNDPVAMFMLYIAINLFLDNKWTWGCVVYSLAVSIKMNILLFAPAVFILLLSCQGLKKTLKNICICALVQMVLGLPFLVANPVGYIFGAFNLGRIFLHKWTVNWRFLPEEIFVSREFHMVLLALHGISLLLFLSRHCWKYIQGFWSRKFQVQLSGNAILLPLFTCNFIGIVFSRSLHYQFYVWYFHSLPYLLWSTSLNSLWRISILGIIELAWNTYPSTIYSSAALHVCHFIILICLWRQNAIPMLLKQQTKKRH